MFAALVTLLAGGWLSLTVRHNYGGHWNALFMTGGNFGAPPGVEFQDTYLFAGSNGYDGQFYRVIAHDPGLQRGFFLDSPRLRYKRILVPALAYAFALGRPWLIDTAYIVTVLGFLFMGTYWMARWAVLHERSPLWGLAFAAVPATLVSLDRMTPDVALAALCCAWALYASANAAAWKTCAVLALAPFARETGLLLSAGSAIGAWRARKFHFGALALATATPYIGWWGIVAMRTPPDSTNWFAYPPLAGIAAGLRSGLNEPAQFPLYAILVALDFAAVCGMVMGIGLSVAWLWRNRGDQLAVAAVLFALLAAQTGRADVWAHVFSFGRVFSPMLLLLGLRAIATRSTLFLMPLLLTLPRVAVQFALQVLGAKFY